jgi:hypothetical protein
MKIIVIKGPHFEKSKRDAQVYLTKLILDKQVNEIKKEA